MKNDKMEEPKSKKEKNDQLEADICAELEEKHMNEYNTLWAKLIRSDCHNSYDEPPPIPLIIGGKEKSHKKESMSDVMVGAATDLAQALKTSTAAGSSTPVTTATYSHQLSPNNKANIRRKCLEDLHILQLLTMKLIILVVWAVKLIFIKALVHTQPSIVLY